MDIIVASLIPLANTYEYKLHLACRSPDNDDPLDVFVRSQDDWKGWNTWRGSRDDFSRRYIFSLIKDYHTSNLWLFGGIFEVTARHADRYDVTLVQQGQEFVGRLVVRFDRPKNWKQGRARNLENHYDQLLVSDILRDLYSGETFPGYENINHPFHRLEMIIKNQKQDWKVALENVKGVYLITDTSNNKRYVGSAYGDTGIWSRWACYIDTGGHGWNDELTKLIQAQGIDYARRNFVLTLLEYRPMKTDDTAIIQREGYWKEVLMSRLPWGYNKN